MNAKLVQFRKALPKIKNKGKNHSHISSNKEIESYYDRKSRGSNKSIYEGKDNEKFISLRSEPEEDLSRHERKMPYPSYLGSRVESKNKMYDYLDG